MTRKFNIKDIVTLDGNSETLFIIVDYFDFTEIVSNGKEIEDIDYELIQILPVKRVSKSIIVGQNDINIHSEYGSKNNESCLKFVLKTREELHIYGVPDYINIANDNIKDIETYESYANNNNNMNDVIRYDLIDSVDECLDAINDLNLLHNKFGDEAYIQLIEFIKKRLIELIK